MKKHGSIFLLALLFGTKLFCQLDTTHVSGRRSMMFSIYSLSTDTFNLSEDSLVVLKMGRSEFTTIQTSNEAQPAHFKANLLLRYDSDSAFAFYDSPKMDTIGKGKDAKTIAVSKRNRMDGKWKLSGDLTLLELDFPEWNSKSFWQVEMKENYYLFIRVKK